VLVRTITADGEPAGHVVSWWKEDRRFVVRLLEKCGFEKEGTVVYDGDEYTLLALRRR
jgi:hypothetical protein